MSSAHRILITPLNWGLGHASRCIPLIEEFILQGAEVILASDGRAGKLLKEEFPKLSFFELPSYGIRYPSKFMIYNMAVQFPTIWNAVRQEKKAIHQIVRENDIHTILSDNRYGCYNANTHNIFLTHQLQIQTPFRWMDQFSEKVNHRLLRPFQQIWVPDYEGDQNLSGRLSHDCSFKRQKYIGPLSRMKLFKEEKKYDVIVVLSGPEPQRSILEDELLSQAMALPKYQFLFVQGKTEVAEEQQLAGHIKAISFLTSKQLNQALLASKYIVSRTGYSTLMDLHAIGRPALLIPTPGQTEQEYLGHYLKGSAQFVVQRQGSIVLEKGLKELSLLKVKHQFKREAGFHAYVSKVLA